MARFLWAGYSRGVQYEIERVFKRQFPDHEAHFEMTCKKAIERPADTFDVIVSNLDYPYYGYQNAPSKAPSGIELLKHTIDTRPHVPFVLYSPLKETAHIKDSISAGEVQLRRKLAAPHLILGLGDNPIENVITQILRALPHSKRPAAQILPFVKPEI